MDPTTVPDCPEEIGTPRPAERQAIFVLSVVLSLHHSITLARLHIFARPAPN